MEVSKRIKRAKISEEYSHPTNILDLPWFIIMNIVARLNIDSICTCRCVCKLLLSLISEPHFTQVYSEISQFRSVVYYINGLGYFLQKYYQNYYRFIVPETHKKAKLVGCCKGLLCLMTDFNYFGIYESPEHLIQIFNPILRQYVTLPIASITKDMKEVYGFGDFGSKATSDYKVLRITTLRNDQPGPIHNKCSKAEVFSLGKSVEWRSVGYAPYPYNNQFPSASFNGALHWISEDEVAESGILCAFDLEKERVQEIPFPPQIGRCNTNMSVAVLGDYVCLIDSSDPVRLSVWTVKENGKCWSLFHMRIPPPPLVLSPTIEPLTVFKDAGISMKHKRLYCFSYHSRHSLILSRACNYVCARWFRVRDANFAAFTPNFSSLHEVVKNLWISKV